MFQVSVLLKGRKIMRLMRFSLSLLEVTARYRIPGMWPDKRWYCTTTGQEVEAWTKSFSPKRGNKSTSLVCCLALLSMSCACLCCFEAFCSQRGGCQMPCEGAYSSLVCGPWRWAAVKYKWPSQARGRYTFSLRPRLYQRQAGRIVSPESRQIFIFLWLSKEGWWQGNTVPWEGTGCTMPRQL